MCFFFLFFLEIVFVYECKIYSPNFIILTIYALQNNDNAVICTRCLFVTGYFQLFLLNERKPIKRRCNDVLVKQLMTNCLCFQFVVVIVALAVIVIYFEFVSFLILKSIEFGHLNHFEFEYLIFYSMQNKYCSKFLKVFFILSSQLLAHFLDRSHSMKSIYAFEC